MKAELTPSVLSAAFISGALFGAGLVVGGMTDPSKIFAFLDFFGDWDASLMFVMGGAIAVNAPLTWWLRRREKPILQASYSIPASSAPWRSQLNAPLLVGAALFGVGWGLGGYCPGPALVSLPGVVDASSMTNALTFTLAMIAGMMAHSVYDKQRQRKEMPSGAACCSADEDRGTLAPNGIPPSSLR